MPLTPLGGYDSDFADQIRRMLQLGGTAPGVQNANMVNFGNPAPTSGPGPGNVAPVPLSSSTPAPVGNNPYAAAAAVPGPAPAPAPPIAANPPAPVAASVAQPQPQPYGGPMAAADAARPPPIGGASAHMPFPGQTDPAGVFAPRPGAAPTTPAASSPASTSTAAPAAAARPQSPNLGYYPPNPRFGTMQSQVPGSGGGPLSRAPIYTTLNLFGGGGAQPAAAANPKATAAAPAPNKYPGDEGWDVDAQGNPIPSTSNPRADPTQMSSAALASAVSKPNWWQQFGRPDMTSDQLARAVKKPNWWQNT